MEYVYSILPRPLCPINKGCPFISVPSCFFCPPPGIVFVYLLYYFQRKNFNLIINFSYSCVAVIYVQTQFLNSCVPCYGGKNFCCSSLCILGVHKFVRGSRNIVSHLLKSQINILSGGNKKYKCLTEHRQVDRMYTRTSKKKKQQNKRE